VSEARSDIMVESGIVRSAAFLAAFLAACFFMTGVNASPTGHRQKIPNDTRAKLSELPSSDLQAADPAKERGAYIHGGHSRNWCYWYPIFCYGRNRLDFEAVRADDSLPASSSSSNDIQGPKLRMSNGEEEGERANAGDDVMVIKRQKRFIKGLAKLICKRFPKFCLNMYLGRNRMNIAVGPVNADESYPPPSSDIEGPDSLVYN